MPVATQRMLFSWQIIEVWEDNPNCKSAFKVSTSVKYTEVSLAKASSLGEA